MQSDTIDKKSNKNLIKCVLKLYLMSSIKLFPQEIELVNLAKALIRQNKQIRVHSGHHSKQFDNLFYIGQNIIDVTKHTIPPFVENNVLTASAGHQLGYLRDFLRTYQLKLRGTPESKYITLGGAVLNGIHHGSHLSDSISDYVKEMLIIDGNGSIRNITDPKLFINYGTLGILFRVKITCFTAINHFWQRKVLNHFDQIQITPNTHSVVFGPYSGEVLKTQLYETDMEMYKSWKRIL